MPKNARLVALLLQALGTDQLDCEPRVIPQLMDLMHRPSLLFCSAHTGGYYISKEH